MDENQDAPEVLETPAEPVESTEAPPEAPQTDEEKEQLRQKLAETEAKNRQLFERLKKQETAPKVEAPAETFSPKDTLALYEAKVSSEDFDEVVRAAKVLGKPLHEALKDPVVKTILETRSEERKSASVAHTRGGARGVSKVTGDDLLRKAQTSGEVPDSDDAMRQLAEARLARKKETKGF